MPDHLSIQNRLRQFIETDKYKHYVHLQPAVESSAEADKELIEKIINNCCHQLLNYLQAGKQEDENMKQIIRAAALQINNEDIDTEDREFGFSLCNVIEEIVGVNAESEDETGAEEQILEDLQRLAAKAGIDLSQFLPPVNR